MFSKFVISQVKHNSYFLLGLAFGLWLSLAVVPLEDGIEPCITASAPSSADEFEPQREDKPLGSGGQTGGRSIQRPRYYSTELGMRGSLLSGVLSSEAALGTRVAALNRTASRLQPGFKFFITASALQGSPGLANVVGFTDTREMLKPFHALKYLADNYLEEYDFFFLVSDTSFVNAQRLTELVSQLSVSQDIYMGTVAEDDSHYCTLEGGILLSNSVLRAVHAELDWCVRNSYSPHHHENVGRCVLHSAHLACTASAQGEQYVSAQLPAAGPGGALALGQGGVLGPALAAAVTAYPVTEPEHFYQLHAYLSRVHLERGEREARALRLALWRGARRLPAGFRNGTWPGGLRADAGLLPPPPDSRFDHLRWTAFNGTHALFPDDHHAVTPLPRAHRQALDLVMESVRAWAAVQWGGEGGEGGAEGAGGATVSLVEGAWRWEPAVALTYRLLLRDPATKSARLVEAVRPLGGARLVPLPYVTESARVHVVLPVPVSTADTADAGGALADAAAFLQRYEALALDKDRNTALYVVLVGEEGSQEAAPAPAVSALHAAAGALRDKHRGATVTVLTAAGGEGGAQAAAAAALHAALPRTPHDALVLLAAPHIEFNEDFLNRVRMNSIPGRQWFLPVGFSRFAHWQHPRARDAAGNRPTTNTGRFNAWHADVAAFYRADYEQAAAQWRGVEGAAPAAVLAAARALHCVRAPEPGLVLAARPPPCGLARTDPADPQCLRALAADQFTALDLGARHSLAKLLLEVQAEVDAA